VLGGLVTEDLTPPHAAGRFPAGSRITEYRIDELIRRGGMAEVYRAWDEHLKRQVALKIPVPELAEDPEFRRRFIRESQAAAAVQDPHIIPVYGAGEADGVPFIAMQFVDGDLRRVLAREGALPPDRAMELISPVASALDAAHAAGLVHRDVKPANILVDARQGRPDHVYLSDFGVSKGAVSSVSLTRPGQFLGTPDYSAPEQIEGRVVDGRTDQYALACVAYQLLTGEVPFKRDQAIAVLLAHMSAPPPSLASRRPGLPGAADQVLAKALAKDPEKRYKSCRDFADALREALGLRPYVPDGGIRRERRLGGPQAIVIAAVITAVIGPLAVVVITHLLAQGPSKPGPTQTPTPAPTNSARPGANRPSSPPNSASPTGPPSASVVTVLMTEEAAASLEHRPADAVRLYVPTAFVRDDACGKPNQSTTWYGQAQILQRYQQLGAFKWLQHQNAEVSFTPDNAQAASATATAQTAGFLEPSSTLPAGLELHGNERWTFIRVNGKWLISSFIYNTACLAQG